MDPSLGRTALLMAGQRRTLNGPSPSTTRRQPEAPKPQIQTNQKTFTVGTAPKTIYRNGPRSYFYSANLSAYGNAITESKLARVAVQTPAAASTNSK